MGKSVHTRAYDRFRELLKQLEAESGKKQRVLSREMGKSDAFMNKVESGYRRMDVVEFVHLCAVLKVSPSKTLAGIEKELLELLKSDF